MHRLKFSIKTLSPIVLTSTSNSTVMTETYETFSGSIIRGVLASRFVKVQKLKDEAHDETFREIFFGGLKFLPANPEVLNKRSFVLPLSLQRGKAGTPDKDTVYDLLKTQKNLRGYKSFRGFGVLDEDKKFQTAQVKTNISMHMSRSGDNDREGKERLAGRSTDGQIYNYESIDAEQIFQGEIRGDEKILHKLIDGLKLNNGELIAYIGRSHFTQYGKCLLTFGAVEKIPVKNFSNEIFLRLDTPLIPADDCFISAKKILETEVAKKLGDKFLIGKVFASSIEVENFVVPWGMKRPRVMGLAAGSVFELNFSAALTDDDKKLINEKLFEGFGMRTEEGFGQLKVWHSSEKFTVGEPEKPKVENYNQSKKLSIETVNLAKKILRERLFEQVRLYAYKDAGELRKQMKLRSNMTHFFSRLGALLENVDKKNIRENFKARLNLEVRAGSQFEAHLENLYMANGKKFSDVFIKNSSLPRKVQDVRDDSKLKDVRADINFKEEDFSDDEFFLEYVRNYFRFARKIASDSKGDAANE